MKETLLDLSYEAILEALVLKYEQEHIFEDELLHARACSCLRCIVHRSKAYLDDRKENQ